MTITPDALRKLAEEFKREYYFYADNGVLMRIDRISILADVADNLIEALTQAAETIERMEGALRPFAEIGKIYSKQVNEHVPDDKEVVTVYTVESGDVRITVGDLRAAHRVVTD